MTERNTTRRRFLQGAGGATTIALAGYTGSLGANEDRGTTDTTKETMGNETTTSEGMDGGTTTDDEGPTDPADAPRAEIDRFSEDAGTLYVRSESNDLPGPGEPINFDQNFLTQGLGPDGQTVQYYDFDVQPTTPAPIYAFFREGEDMPVEGQRNVIGVIPGDEGYNDFWRVYKVMVPEDYEANTVTSVAEITEADYDIEATDTIKNCPVVPDESTASMRYGGDAVDSSGLIEGWYDGQVIYYFLFEEAPLETTDNGAVPRSPLYVTFNKNPDEEGGGPPSGFMTEEMSPQTHNVVATLPDDEAYSPLWRVNVYDNADFDSVTDLSSATNAEILEKGVANVNCPVVSVE